MAAEIDLKLDVVVLDLSFLSEFRNALSEGFTAERNRFADGAERILQTRVVLRKELRLPVRKTDDLIDARDIKAALHEDGFETLDEISDRAGKLIRWNLIVGQRQLDLTVVLHLADAPDFDAQRRGGLDHAVRHFVQYLL